MINYLFLFFPDDPDPYINYDGYMNVVHLMELMDYYNKLRMMWNE